MGENDSEMKREPQLPEREFESFVGEHRRLIGKICYLYATAGSDFDDLYQEVLINLWRGFASFEGRSKPSSWVWRVALNTCISCYRRERRRTQTLPLVEGFGAVDEDSARSERLRELHALVDRLDPFEKALVMLWLDEVPYDEIAAITGLSRNNVASKLHRIRIKLREQANR